MTGALRLLQNKFGPRLSRWNYETASRRASAQVGVVIADWQCVIPNLALVARGGTRTPRRQVEYLLSKGQSTPTSHQLLLLFPLFQRCPSSHTAKPVTIPRLFPSFFHGLTRTYIIPTVKARMPTMYSVCICLSDCCLVIRTNRQTRQITLKQGAAPQQIDK